MCHGCRDVDRRRRRERGPPVVDRRRRGRRPRRAAAARRLRVDDGGIPTLTWYINPDPNPPDNFSGAFGQAGIAERCSTDEYKVETELLPTSASEQRIQLLRRLSADDPSIDLMSLDPVFTAEFADAGALAPFSADAQATLSDGVLQGAIDGATWDGQLVVAPLWANTQVLWYRKSRRRRGRARHDPAGDVGPDHRRRRRDRHATSACRPTSTRATSCGSTPSSRVPAATSSATPRPGSDATIDIGSEAGAEAAHDHPQAGRLVGRRCPTCRCPTRAPCSGRSPPTRAASRSTGRSSTTTTPTRDVIDDLGWARYPETVAGQESRPPIGGINVGIGAFTDEPEFAAEAVQCITSEENQVQYAVETANMPAREAAYDDPGLQEQFPADLLELFRTRSTRPGPVRRRRTGRRSSTPRWPSGTRPTR